MKFLLRRAALSMVLGFAAIQIVPGARAAEFFVATWGSDSNPGTIDRPWKTILRGIQGMSRGDILSIRAGIYYSTYVWLDSKPGLSWAQPTVIRSFPGEQAEIRITNLQGGGLGGNDATRFVIFAGLRVDQSDASPDLSCFKFQGSSDVILTNCVLANSGTHGVLMTPGDSGDSRRIRIVSCTISNWGVGWTSTSGRSWPHGVYNEGVSNIIENCYIHHGNPQTGNGATGIKNGQGTASYNLCRNNVIHDVSDGINVVEGVGNRVYGNVIFNHSRMGIWVYNSAESSLIANNTIFNGYNGIVSQLVGPNNVVVNNLIFHLSEFGLFTGPSHSGGSTYWSNNLAYDVRDNDPGNGIWSGNLVHARPAASPYDAKFADYASQDMHLLAGSSAQGVGLNLSAYFTSDHDGTLRPATGPWDVGAYGYAPGGSANRPPTISPLGNQSTVIGIPIPALPFTVSDPETSPDNLTTTVTSSDQALVPNGNLLIAGPGASRTLTITPAAAQLGTTTIRITVSDGTNTAATSFQLTVTQPTAANTPPRASAGPNQSITLPAPADLNAEVSDDGLPTSPGALTSGWSLVSGPGTVNFGNANALQTTAWFSTSGTYTLRLSASDGELTSQDQLVVTVSPPSTPTNVVSLQIEAESGSLASPMTISSQNAFSFTRLYISSPSDNLGSASYSFNTPVSGDYFIWCRVLAPAPESDSFYAAVDGGTEIPYIASEGTPIPTWRWTRINQRVTGSTFAVSPRVFSFNPGIHTLVLRCREANTFLDTLLITNDPNLVPTLDPVVVNTAPNVSTGPNQTITLPSPVSLGGVVIDDGLPASPGTVTAAWSKVSGPGTVVFANPNSPATTATFSGSGTYVLRLTAFDGALSSSSEVTLQVNPAPSNEIATIQIEAEAGSLISPMALYSSTGPGLQTPTGDVIGSPSDNAGTASYIVNLPSAGDYTIWCRILAETEQSDSFYVAVDGEELPYVASEGLPSSAWRWTCVNRRVSATPFSITQRVFSLTSGPHTFQFRSREANTFLDRFVITNDPQYLPPGASPQAPIPQIFNATFTENGISLGWPSLPGRTYRVYYKDSPADSEWTSLSGDLLASSNSMYLVDIDSTLVPQRFYAVYLVP